MWHIKRETILTPFLELNRKNKKKNASTLIGTAYEGAAVPRTNINAPDGGRAGRKML
jgi:hypothetical protein